jgi:hypothetical protein
LPESPAAGPYSPSTKAMRLVKLADSTKRDLLFRAGRAA